MRIGNTGEEGEFLNTVEFSLELESNPFFTASVLVATARAVKRFLMNGQRFLEINNLFRRTIGKVNMRQQLAHPMSEFLGTVDRDRKSVV